MTAFRVLFLFALGLFVCVMLRESVGGGLAIMLGVAAQALVGICVYWALKWNSPSSRLRRLCRKQLAEYQRRYQPYREEKK